MRRATAVHEIVQDRVIAHLELAKQMLNFLIPHDQRISPFSLANYFKGRRAVLQDVINLDLARFGPPENRYEYVLLTDESFEPIFNQVGIEAKDIIITDPELAAAIRLEYWLRHKGPCPLIIEPFRESSEFLD